MKRKLLCAAAILFVGAVAVMCIHTEGGGAAGETNAERVKYIESFGWKTETAPCEQVSLILPAEFDSVYEQYNKILREEGLDIRPYMGKSAVRYTYRIKNHKNANGREVRANLLVCDGKIIAADVMTTYIGGFMHAINRTEYVK